MIDIHYLHVGKTAGTLYRQFARDINTQVKGFQLIAYRHDKRLTDIPWDEPYLFVTRNPYTRFVSGFYSRKRKGRPRAYNEWSAYEKKAFTAFEHANDYTGVPPLSEKAKENLFAWYRQDFEYLELIEHYREGFNRRLKGDKDNQQQVA